MKAVWWKETEEEEKMKYVLVRRNRFQKAEAAEGYNVFVAKPQKLYEEKLREEACLSLCIN